MRPLPLIPLLLLAASVRADQALVVGVQEYRPLVAASTLGGCVNDARSMADLLKKEGFQVRLMLNLDATRTGVLGEVERIASTIKPGERFVFYFAGHGRSTPHYALMPSNCSREGNDITTDELHAAISAIKARSKTVILDSCFSGGMAAGSMARGGDEFRARFFDPYEDRSVKFGPAPKKVADPPPAVAENPPAGDASVCYYVAALSSEQALEGTMPDGKRHGLFTYALVNNLKPKELWSDAHQGVKRAIGDKLQDSGRTQNPSISAGFLGAPTFDAPRPGARPVSTKTLREAWNVDNPNPKRLSIRLTPDADVVEVGRPIRMEIKVGVPGYLIVLGEVDGRLYPFYPASGAARAVKKGTLKFPGEKERLFFDDFGADHVKAMLYATAGEAGAVFDALKGANGGARDLVLARAAADAPVTARLSMAVGDSLAGGLRPKSLDALYARVVGGKDDAARALLARLGAAAQGYPRGRAWAASPRASNPTRADKEAFLTLLNLAIAGGSLYDEAAMKGRVPKKLADDLKKKPKGDRLMALNRALLAALYPEEVNPDDARDR